MSPKIKELIVQAENETWSKMNSFGTVLEAVSFSKVSFLKERIATLAILECAKICEQNNDQKSLEQIKQILSNQDDPT